MPADKSSCVSPRSNEKKTTAVAAMECGCCWMCGSSGRGVPLKTCCVCGNRSCRPCVMEYCTMFRRTSGWKCAGCVGTPSLRHQQQRNAGSGFLPLSTATTASNC